MQNIFCRNCFRAYPGISKGYIFRNRFIQVMTNHQHIQMFINCIYCKRPCWISRRRQYIWIHGSFDNIRCMTATGAFCMIGMNHSSIDSFDGIFQKPCFIQCIGMNGYLHIMFISNFQ